MVRLSQTSVKDLEAESTCPYRWKKQWIDNEFSFKSNKHTIKGEFFEYLCIGGSAHEKQPITDLERLKNGSKSADQKRIEEQAERFKNMVDPSRPEFQGYILGDTQVELNYGDDTGVVDMYLYDLSGNLYLGDLKLTSDLNSTVTKYSWGHSLSYLDLLQATTYSRLHKKMFPDDYDGYLPFVYFIYDYSTSKRVKIGEVNVTKRGINNSKNRFDEVRVVVQKYNENGWVKIPSKSECKGCPLKCDSRIKEEDTIIRENITL